MKKIGILCLGIAAVILVTIVVLLFISVSYGEESSEQQTILFSPHTQAMYAYLSEHLPGYTFVLTTIPELEGRAILVLADTEQQTAHMLSKLWGNPLIAVDPDGGMSSVYITDEFTLAPADASVEDLLREGAALYIKTIPYPKGE